MIVSRASPLLADGLGELALLWVKPRVQQQAGHADDGVHRRADFVAHGGQKCALGLAGLACLFLRSRPFDDLTLRLLVELCILDGQCSCWANKVSRCRSAAPKRRSGSAAPMVIAPTSRPPAVAARLLRRACGDRHTGRHVPPTSDNPPRSMALRSRPRGPSRLRLSRAACRHSLCPYCGRRGHGSPGWPHRRGPSRRRWRPATRWPVPRWLAAARAAPTRP